ncbi:MAG: cytochrome P450 [Caulobacteraceae bacterium]
MSLEIPAIDDDVFSHDAVLNARAVDDGLRERAPVVWLNREGIAVLGRWEHVADGLRDWETFSNTSRPWHDPNSVRPEILLTDDPPKHTRVRAIIGSALSPRALKAMGEHFDKIAAAQVDQLMARGEGVVDAVADITAPFVHQVLPDVIGLPEWGRENMTAFGHAVWATMGPMNDLFEEAMTGAEPLLEWAGAACDRENLSTDRLGMEMFKAADRGEITADEAKLLTLTMLSAGADTTVLTMASAIRAFCLFPEQWAALREQPSLLRNAFDESLRWDSPSRMAGRIAMKDVEIEDYVIPAGTRCGLLFGAANRDPRKWVDPERYDITRDLRGHVGWGYGIHACVGRTLAQLEADALLGALISRVERFEAAGDPEWWMTTIGHGPVKLPVRLHPAAH